MATRSTRAKCLEIVTVYTWVGAIKYKRFGVSIALILVITLIINSVIKISNAVSSSAIPTARISQCKNFFVHKMLEVLRSLGKKLLAGPQNIRKKEFFIEKLYKFIKIY